jgi:pimeloyl-ACP methyl ester carboxylesterase
MDYFTADGLIFDVTDEGPADGEVIVLLHGYPETRAMWDGVIPLLSKGGYRVLAPDQRGYSPRARPPRRRDYRMENLMGDVLALADAAEADRFHVVGHDWGGAVAWALATWRPERLYSMTSLATPNPAAMRRAFVTSTQAFRSWYMALFQLPRLPELGMTSGLGRRMFRRTLRRSGLADASIDRYLAALTEPGAATGALTWYRAMVFPPPGKMRPVDVPTLYVYGAGDFALGRKAADLTGRYVKAPYRYEVLEGVSHWIPEEVPDRVADLVTEQVRAYGRAA